MFHHLSARTYRARRRHAGGKAGLGAGTPWALRAPVHIGIPAEACDTLPWLPVLPDHEVLAVRHQYQTAYHELCTSRASAPAGRAAVVRQYREVLMALERELQARGIAR